MRQKKLKRWDFKGTSYIERLNILIKIYKSFIWKNKIKVRSTVSNSVMGIHT